ncbi:MAG: NF038122 family metalloprotease [Acidobacteriota bacterium]
MKLVNLHKVMLLSLLALSLIVMPLITPLSVSAGGNLLTSQQPSAQMQPSPQLHPRPEAGIFIIRHQGKALSCNDALPSEVEALASRHLNAELQVLTNGKDSTGQLQKNKGLKIILRGTAQLENYPEAKAAMLRAAANWMQQIKNKITMVIDVDFGVTRFGDAYAKDVLGIINTAPVGAANLYAGIRDRFLNKAKSPQEDMLYRALPEDGVPTANGFTKNISAPAAVFRSLGLLEADATSDANTPSIAFNSVGNFDFDARDGIDRDKIDFEGLIAHQIGHVLGFVSNDADNSRTETASDFVSTWDMFRFQPDGSTGIFTTAKRLSLTDEASLFFANPATREDGQSSHWQTEHFGRHTGIMQSTIQSGERLRISNNDLEAMQYIGHTVSLTPASTDDFIALTSGVALTRTMAAPPEGDCLLDPVQYTIQIPSDATQLKVELTGTPNLELFVRINDPVLAFGASVYAHFISAGEDGNESITVDATPAAKIIPGTYYIAIGNCGAGAGDYTIKATVDTPGTAPVVNALAARLDGDTLTLSGTATDLEADVTKASFKLFDESGKELLAYPDSDVDFGGLQTGNFNFSFSGMAQTNTLTAVRITLLLTDAKGNRSSVYTANFNQADAGGPTIKNVTFDNEGDVTIFKGVAFTNAAYQVEINGVMVTPPLNAKLKGVKIKMSGTRAQAGLHAGLNRVRLRLNGAYSNLFLLKLK